MISVTNFLRKNEVRFDQYKLTNKWIIKDQILHNRDVSQQILEKSHSEKIPYEEARERAEEYVDEIVPTFNMLSYYKFGFSIARFLLKFLYQIVIDEHGKEKTKEIPEDTLLVYVMNHRSNIDYLLVAYMLAENISVSYAVGEWARVFPLELIFKSFGAYFVRRNYRDPLYHSILRQYVRLISKNNVTQGIFIEGALSRTGGFRKPKTGLLDYILESYAEEDSSKKIVFVPVGINYDWIVEDKTLISEWKEGRQSMSMGEHMLSLLKIVIKSPYLLIINTLRVLTGRVKEHGYVSVKFGDPIPVENLADMQKFAELDSYGERRGQLKQIGHSLLDKIGDVIPVTPASLLSISLLQADTKKISKTHCITLMRRNLEQLESGGAQLLFGPEYDPQKESRIKLESEKLFLREELLDFERDLIKGDEVEKTLQLAVEIFVTRKIVKVQKNNIIINPDKRDYLEYYANSIRHYLDQQEYVYAEQTSG